MLASAGASRPVMSETHRTSEEEERKHDLPRRRARFGGDASGSR
jgi:hypothetical protein